MRAAAFLAVFLPALLTCSSTAKPPNPSCLESCLPRSTLKFQYCSACGYHTAFQEYAKLIHQKYPEINIKGEDSALSGYWIFYARALAAVKMLCIVCLLSQVNILHYIGVEEQAWWTWCIENKIFSTVVAFFTFSALESYCLSSGAFEIFYNDDTVWSKLATGRFPQQSELFRIINALHQ